jgi:dolichyl-phosphate beta-glucosyltransferase
MWRRVDPSGRESVPVIQGTCPRFRGTGEQRVRSRHSSVSIVIPAYNEAMRLANSLCVIIRYLHHYRDSELIVVDDGSSDGTADVARRIMRSSGRVATRVLRYDRNRGKGYALKTGLLAAEAPVALFSDADLSAPITELPRLVEPIARGEIDIAFGSRALDRSLTHIRQPWLRETGGRVFNLLTRAATGLPFWDTQCGFKAFRMDVFRPILRTATIDRFAFDVEWLYVAHRAGLRLREVPVRWDHQEGSKVSMRRDSLRMIHEVHQIRRRADAGAYDAAIDEIRALRRHSEQPWRLQTLDQRSAIA